MVSLRRELLHECESICQDELGGVIFGGRIIVFSGEEDFIILQAQRYLVVEAVDVPLN